MKILKFGGSSLATPERIEQVIAILKKQTEQSPFAVVFSAFGGVTDQLIDLATTAAAGREYLSEFARLEQRHLDTVHFLVAAPQHEGVACVVKASLDDLADLLHGAALIREMTPRLLDCIMSFGERLAVTIIAAAMNQRGLAAEALDARLVVKTDAQFGAAQILKEATSEGIRAHFKARKAIQVITGFIGSTQQEVTTTLGRGGSDYSAAIFGAALGADEIEIWSDVNGVMTADPAKVRRAFPLDAMSYEEAMELSHFGAKVLHPPTMQPAMAQRIPIRIRNTFDPGFPGTVVRAGQPRNGSAIKGITSISDIALLRVQGSGMIGVSGVAGRLFSALARHAINIILITQASSEHSISLAVEPRAANRAKEIIEEAFEMELQLHRVEPVVVEKDLAIIAVVGENMRRTTGVSGRLFEALGRSGINVVAIAQGSSELNISVVVEKEAEAQALNVIHDAFFFPQPDVLHLFLIGAGTIGGALLDQIAALSTDARSRLRLMAIAQAEGMVISAEDIDTRTWRDRLATGSERMHLAGFLDRMIAGPLANRVFVDCTASEEISRQYERILRAGIHIVTPNKKANAADQACYDALRRAARDKGTQFLYETNVGAGLPVLSTLRDLLQSGDTILKIEAVLSGTLSYVLERMHAGVSFTTAVREAQAAGFAEPDPGDDLRGVDVARKLLILAREMGRKLEWSDIAVEPLCDGTAPEEMQRADAVLAERVRQAIEQGRRLVYAGVIAEGTVHAGLQTFAADDALARLAPGENLIRYTTQRYRQVPLLVRGPGAGAEVTAGGVLADILRLQSGAA